MAILSYFGRETSLVNIMGPRSIFPPLFTPAIYFLLYFLFCCYHYHYYPVRFVLCKQQGQSYGQPLYIRWEQSYLLCMQVHVNRLIAGAVVTFLSLSESYWRQTLVSSPTEICCCLHLNLPLWVTKDGREAITC